jgi:hypothetical protein
MLINGWRLNFSKASRGRAVAPATAKFTPPCVSFTSWFKEGLRRGRQAAFAAN